ncbi:hypothetical protein M514_07438 [Trichuris suis]|uniref:PDZ domain-containing protein n=1 Tax=Trichuris suis TaxID=68888 RepID=A0A085NCD3_9BILA|nr:hypothetical protein M514_07438 [Trichuris suis]
MRFNGERSLREWPGHLDDQVQRLVALQREMILLSRRLGPHEHRLLLELVDLHDRLWSLTDMFKSRLVTSPSVKASQQLRLSEKVEKEEEPCRQSSAVLMTSTGTQTDFCGQMLGDESEQVVQENEYALCEWRDLTVPVSVASVDYLCQERQQLRCTMQYTAGKRLGTLFCVTSNLHYSPALVVPLPVVTGYNDSCFSWLAGREISESLTSSPNVQKLASFSRLIPVFRSSSSVLLLSKATSVLMGHFEAERRPIEERRFGRVFEQVNLVRVYPTQKLGLTLCYSAADNEETEIFVSEIKAGSLANRDGRIKTGDQVLEINGVNVRSRSQAVELFRQERHRVSILLARRLPRAMVDNEFSPIEEEDEGTQTDRTSAHEKDSGISRTTDSELELMPSLASPSKLSEFSTDGSHSSELISIADEYEALKDRTRQPVDLEAASVDPVDACHSFGNGQQADSGSSLEHELQCLQREMEHVQLECDRLIEQHVKAENAMKTQLQKASVLVSTVNQLHLQSSCDVESTCKASQQPQTKKNGVRSSPRALPPRGVVRVDHIRGLVGQSNVSFLPKNASITGGHVSRELQQRPLPLLKPRQSPVEIPADDDGKRDSAFFSLPHYKTNEFKVANGSKGLDVGVKNVYDRLDEPPDLEDHIYASISGETVYTNLDNLQTTIRRQQQSLRQAVIQQALTTKLHPKDECCRFAGRHPVERAAPMTKASHAQECVKMEWKVKRRADGTRYITRRPVRKQILRDRAERLASERFGCSTDDDAASELKVGRYWSKEERRQHRERCKERKKRQEELLRRKAERKPLTEQQILQLSYKKMLRRQGQQLLDRFTTIQEFLAHGNRTAENYRALGLLSVTTV